MRRPVRPDGQHTSPRGAARAARASLPHRVHDYTMRVRIARDPAVGRRPMHRRVPKDDS